MPVRYDSQINQHTLSATQKRLTRPPVRGIGVVSSFVMSLLTIFVATGALTSCQQFVQGVTPPINLINDKDLTTEENLPTLYSSLGGYLATYARLAMPYASTLSDEFTITESVSTNITDITFRGFDNGSPQLFTTNTIWGRLGALRFHAMDILERVPDIAFSEDSNRARALYLGYFFAGFVEHQYAAFFGLTARQGGGVLNGGPFVPSAAMHDSALSKFTLALQNARTPYERRVVNSFVARIHLLEGRYSQALAAAQNGLQQGDSAFSALYYVGGSNTWNQFAGENTHQIMPDARFRRYVEADPAEAGRIPLVLGKRGIVTGGTMTRYFIQAKYTADTSPLPLLTWQENALMIAECQIRAGAAAAALVEVNRVRASSPPVVVDSISTSSTMLRTISLAPRTTTTLDSIYIERDKQLFAIGLRLLDQRRFNRWHFPASNAESAWYFLPISESERSNNPNLSN
jgi:starch-binding outer membrane protein, SusD/RagB family